jgi:hypothetical protein
VIPDAHAHFQYDHSRADLLAHLINDLRPDVVINIGDGADMPSLCHYDKGKRGFNGRTYRQDIDAHLEFQDRIWDPVVRRKKKLPRTVYCIGNHEQRIEKALDLSPELVGTIGLSDLELSRWYDDVVEYRGGTPGVIDVDGILYAHYFISGVMGRPVGGEHPGYSLLNKHFASATSGHLHLADMAIRTDGHGKKIIGAFCGCYQDYDADWAGESNRLWWRGVLVKHNVENGSYDPEFISLDQLRKIYSDVR